MKNDIHTISGLESLGANNIPLGNGCRYNLFKIPVIVLSPEAEALQKEIDKEFTIECERSVVRQIKPRVKSQCRD